MAKVSKVTLENKALNVTEQYEINHAERLLRMPNNGGWQLPDNSPYVFSFDNGIGYKKNQKANSGAEEKADD